MLIAVDPGVERCGVAWFDDVLFRVELRSTPITTDGPFACVCEKPQIYPGSRVRTADLVDLAIAAGRMTSALATEYVLPRTWKGQIPCTCNARRGPDVCPHHRRMLAALSPAERAVIDAFAIREKRKALLHNAWDAVSLGLWRLERI